MNGIKRRLATYDVLRLVLIIWLVVLMPLMAAADVLFDHSDDDCESECDESCQDCGTCANCARTVHMIPVTLFQMNSPLQASIGGIAARSHGNEESFAAGIDHPPQNIL